MEYKPLVSVIITTCNGSDTVERAIKSVLNQDYSNIEIIVVDDNGIDSDEHKKTKKIVESFENIKYISHKVRKNGSAARNSGAHEAKGELLSFLDDDDEFLNNKISLQVKKFGEATQNTGLVYCSFIDEDQNGNKKTFKADKKGRIVLYSLLDKVKVATSLFIVRKQVFDELNGFDESFRRHQDWEFVARLTDKYEVDFVPEVCVIKHSIARNEPINIKVMEEYRLHYLKKLKPIIDSKKEKKKIYCYHYICFVKEYIKKGRIDKFLEYLIKSRAPLTYLKIFFEVLLKSKVKRSN